jgi:hypothetical protein
MAFRLRATGKLGRKVLAVFFVIGCSSFLAAATTDVQLSPPSQPPLLNFACELDSASLQALFADPTLIPDLQQLHAGVTLALGDFSPERAAIVRRLNEAGIPVTAWLALPMEQGYYLNASNEPQAAQRFAAFQMWTADNMLHWSAIGLDIEPNIQEFAAIKDHKLRLAGMLLKRYFQFGKVKQARSDYSALIHQMQTAGYSVETYQFPFLADERAAHTTVLERLFGLVDVPANREVFMIYTSFNHSMDSAMIWAYGPEAQVIAVGSTKSDPASDEKFPPLNWDEFSRDLLVASHFSQTVGVFSLEGCVRQGFMPRLKSMDWSRPVTIPGEAIHNAQQLRARFHRALWLAANFPWFILAALALIVTWFWRRRANSNPAAARRA